MIFLRSFLVLLAALASAAFPGVAPAAFDFTGPTNRILTPNGDGFNDSVSFRFSNPRDSSGTIRIYDLRGRQVRTLPIVVGDDFKSWDARADGRIVDGGVYVYILSAESRTFSGAMLVIR